MNNNNSIEEAIRAALIEQGVDPESIRKTTKDVLNIVNKASKDNERAMKIKKLRHDFNEAYAKGGLSVNDVATLAALVVTPDFPKWTSREIDKFIKSVTSGVTAMAKLVDSGWTFSTFDEIFDKYRRGF